MIDSLLQFEPYADQSQILKQLGLQRDDRQWRHSLRAANAASPVECGRP